MLGKRLLEQWPLAVLMAMFLAMMPLLNWLGIVLIVLLVLRRGTWFSVVAYVLVAVTCYWAFSGYNFVLLQQDLAGFLAMFLPLLLMVLALRTMRALNLSLALGFACLVVIILLQTLVHGQPSLQAWIEVFNCRLQLMGMTQEQLLAMTAAQNFEQAIRGLMLGWPFAFMLMQVGILFMARWWQAALYNRGGFQAEFHQLRLHKPLALVLAFVLILLGVIGTQSPVIVQLAGVGLLLLAIPGLAFVHWYVKFKQLSRVWLLAVYALLLISSFAAMPLLAMIAMLDSGLNLRLRLNKPKVK